MRSPKMVAEMLRVAVQRWHERRLGIRLADENPTTTGSTVRIDRDAGTDTALVVALVVLSIYKLTIYAHASRHK